MRIAVLSQGDSRGGAAKVAQILAHGLAGRGHDVQFLVRHKHLEGDASVALEWPARRGKSKLKGKVLHRLGVNGLGLTCPFPRNMRADFWRSFDIVHIHDFPEFNWAHFRWLCGLTNVVVTPHTLSWVTGNCLYPYDCDGFTRSCGSCPQFGKFPLLYYHRDGSRLNMWYKRRVTRRMRLGAVVGVSDWVGKEIGRSLWGGQLIEVIRNPAPLESFAVLDKREAKRGIGVREEQPMVLFAGSGSPLDLRKGTDIVAGALREMTPRPLTLCVMGIGPNAKMDFEVPDWVTVHRAGHVSGDEALNNHYSAADLVWHPSRADNLPVLILEAMSSGTPVVACNVGGVSEELGTDGSAGRLIAPESAEELARATEELLDAPEKLREMSEAARRRAALFPREEFLRKHEELYKILMDSRKGRGRR